MDSPFKIRFFGVRGSIPTPLTSADVAEKLEAALAAASPEDLLNQHSRRAFVARLPNHIKGCIGGNSACVQVEAGGHLLIFDAGSGIRELGIELCKGPFGKGAGRAHLIFSHTHWDHIMGLPFFGPLFIPGNRFTICGCHPDLGDRLRGQQRTQYFPIKFDTYGSHIDFVDFSKRDHYRIGEVKITWKEQDHPGKSFAYRVDYGGKSMIYSTDAEYKDQTSDGLRTTTDFFRDADLVIFDSQYTQVEAMEKKDWGHSSMFVGIKLALAAGVKKLAFFHHEPTYSDFMLTQIFRSAHDFLRMISQDGDPGLILAAEGEGVTLIESSSKNGAR